MLGDILYSNDTLILTLAEALLPETSLGIQTETMTRVVSALEESSRDSKTSTGPKTAFS